jgi:1,4-dihydroxy-6-naphthoate synthase
VHGKIDTGDLEFDPILEDVETLNQWALQDKLPVTKLSYAVLPRVVKWYRLLDSGSALGTGVGPLLIRNSKQSADDVAVLPVAIPGEYTTANFLFSLAYPAVTNKVFLRYDEIEAFVLSGKGLGVIIHENRFTYESKGLEKIEDLGNFWENKMKAPIPLGGIVVSKTLPTQIQEAINKLVRLSVEYAFRNLPVLPGYTILHAQEMSEAVMRKHIDLYVNGHSLSLGKDGREAVLKLLEQYAAIYGRNPSPENLFVG